MLAEGTNWISWLPPLATIGAAVIAALIAGSVQEYSREKEYLSELREAYARYIASATRCLIEGINAAHLWTGYNDAKNRALISNDPKQHDPVALEDQKVNFTIYSASYDKYIEYGNDRDACHLQLQLLDRDETRLKQLDNVNKYVRSVLFQGKSKEQVEELAGGCDTRIDALALQVRMDLQREHASLGSFWKFVVPKRLRHSFKGSTALAIIWHRG